MSGVRTMKRTKNLHRRLKTDWGDAELPLTSAQKRELSRRAAFMRSPTRYLLVSDLGDGVSMFYDVSTDSYAWKNPAGGTLFKRREAAEAIRRLLRPGVLVVRCTVTRRNGIEVPVVPSRFRGRTRRPTVYFEPTL